MHCVTARSAPNTTKFTSFARGEAVGHVARFPKINIGPENDGLEDDFPCPGSMLIFRGSTGCRGLMTLRL